MKDLKLYMKPDCPYSRKVMRFADKNRIELKLLDINEEENKIALLRLIEEEQVPCMVADGKTVLGSDEIIKYLAKEFNLNYTEEDLQIEKEFCPIN